MKKFSKVFRYVLLVVVVLTLAAWVYIQSHQPQLKGKRDLAMLSKEVEVYFDPFGIPHIYAENPEDAYRAFGYVHAQDRLFQMELMRRVGEGRLSEIFGAEFLKTDMFFRTLGTNRKAITDAAKFDELPAEAQKICNAYLEGLNTYVREGKLPLEFKMLGIGREEYTMEDMYAISGYMAYSFAAALKTDPLVEKMENTLGMEYLYDLDLGYPMDSLPNDTISENVSLAALLPPDFLEILPVPSFEGSNNWVLGPSRTLSGSVILSNDTHIKYASPSAWYEAHITYPGFSLYGNFLAGVPVALIGHSRNHAWGITMFEDDDSDFFRERFTSLDSSATYHKDSLRADVKKYKETISVKDASDTVITVYETVHGPIVNSFLPVEFNDPISMYWNYTQLENHLVEAFYKMNYSQNMKSFKEGVQMVSSPGLNIAYGDASGNIAMWSASKLIKRPEGEHGKTFLKGYEAEDSYEGYYPFSANPAEVNPAKGYVHSANQYHDTAKGISYPGYYTPPTRYERIDMRLVDMFPATVDSMKSLILDVVSLTEAEVASSIAEIISNSGRTLTDTEEGALELLRTWNGTHLLRDQEPTIYYKTLYYIVRKTFADELGEENFKQFLGTHLFKRSYRKLIEIEDSPWWDNVRTEEKTETREDIVLAAFKKSIAELEVELGAEIKEWRWERVHLVTHPHPLGKVDMLKPFFDVGPFPAPGGIETINNAGFTLNGDGKYIASSGPAMRIIIDFADIENAVSILPTGNSGNIMSPHYDDQANMYVAGEFRKMMMNEREIRETGQKLLLRPEQ